MKSAFICMLQFWFEYPQSTKRHRPFFFFFWQDMNFGGEPIELNYKAFSSPLSILQSYRLSLYQACEWITLYLPFWAIMSHELNYHKTHKLAKHTYSEFQLVQLIKSLVVKRYLGFNLSRPFFRLKACNNIVLDKILKEIILTLNFIAMTHDNLIPSSIYILKKPLME